MKLIDSLFGFFRKESQARQMIAIHQQGKPITSPKNYKAFSKEGYQKNVIAFRCVNLISDSISRLPVCLFQQKVGQKPEKLETHPMLDLLNKPNPMQSYNSFIKSLVGYYLISGNLFAEADAVSEIAPPVELWAVRPDRMSIIPGENGMPSAYTYKVGNKVTKWDVTILGQSKIMHMKTFHPTNDWWGLSPLEAASLDIDMLNESNMWNLGLLQNSARPSGAFVYTSPDGQQAELTENQRSALRTQVEQMYTGSAKAGRPMLLEGGLDWKEMSLTPRDMDFLNSKDTSQKDVALTYGVPSQLVGVKDSQTFANFEQAKLAFYQDTAIPLGNMLLGEFSRWLVPKYNADNLFLAVDENSVPALAPLREKKWEQVQNAAWLTFNEKREATGFGVYEPSDEAADKILVNAGLIPLESAAEELAEEEGEEELVDTEDVLDVEEEEEDEEEEEKSLACIDGKLFNIGSKREKRRFWIRQQKKRRLYEKRFQREVTGFFVKQGDRIAKDIEGIDPALIEMIVAENITKGTPELSGIYNANYKRIMVAFGDDVFNLGRKTMSKMITKDDETRFTSFLHAFIVANTAQKVQKVNQTTKKRITKVVKNALLPAPNEDGEIITPSTREIANDVQDSVKTFSRNRALAIARTETHTASNTAQRNAAKQLQVPGMKKEWLSGIDTRSRGVDPKDSTNHIRMNGVKVELEEKFQVPSLDGSDTMDGPGDTAAPADQIVNCRCTTIFSVD